MSSFAKHYLDARGKEGRLLHAAELSAQPLEPPTTSRKELQFRNFSYRCLLQHLRARRARGETVTRILELGCGVGWLSARLSRDLDVDVIAIDLTAAELFRAQEGAGSVAPRTRFIAACVDAMPIKPHQFDVVIAAAIVQYSPRLSAFTKLACTMCTNAGELLISDSPFYASHELAAARERTLEHYRRIDSAGMASHYHHHSLDELESLQPQWIYSPKNFGQRLIRKFIGHGSPFPIVSLRPLRHSASSSRAGAH